MRRRRARAQAGRVTVVAPAPSWTPLAGESPFNHGTGVVPFSLSSAMAAGGEAPNVG